MPASPTDAVGQLRAWIAQRPPAPIDRASMHDDDAHQVVDGVWISNLATAWNTKYIAKLNITDIISVTRQEPSEAVLEASRREGIQLHAFGMNDSNAQRFIELGEKAADTIADVLSKHGRVLVHCDQGRSRSPSVVILYLMKHRSMTYEVAFETIARGRLIQPNAGFEAELRAWKSAHSND